MKRLFFLAFFFFAWPVYAQDRTEVDVIAPGEYVSGLTVVGRTFDADAQHDRVRCTADRTLWELLPRDAAVRMRIFASLDRGSSWQYLGGATARGGVSFDRQGNPVEGQLVSVTLPPERGGFRRQVRLEFDTIAPLSLRVDCDLVQR